MLLMTANMIFPRFYIRTPEGKIALVIEGQRPPGGCGSNFGYQSGESLSLCQLRQPRSWL